MTLLKTLGRGFAVAAIAGAAALAHGAEKYPDKPVRIVVPFSAGGQFDIAARMLGQFAARELAQPVIIENVPGGGGNIGAARVANSPADGYTLLALGGNHAAANALYAKPGFDVVSDFTPISRVTVSPHVVLVNASLPVKTFPELVAYARRAPNGISYGSPGIGTSMHLTFEMIKTQFGLNAMHVPYKGGANMLTDLAAGQINAGIVALAPAQEFIKAGRMRPLAVTSKTRSPALPDVPSLAELGYPALDTGSWMALAGPKKLPPEVVKRWNGVVQAFFNDAASRAKLEAMAFRIEPSSPEQMGTMLQAESQAFLKVVKENKITAE
ncbi:Tripartite-type tricarboxylate transporter, receptor component TctC [Noviherbaspirillum humi]|uniref:Tripartite-type tricarboxylate transporter, receptor component TctC n=1 Tax=Noviherbaspirillum humi TaxID=1688639 RepID=A0A239EZS6_9BURK|nr:tripartite tricarboxylate transporter substrate binding protein [Noviherbaspirillum humi]SNS49798.1 Tripartite-type tricarboxylate transporter, receptor component TctC [Noviherbaspirillum humi]